MNRDNDKLLLWFKRKELNLNIYYLEVASARCKVQQQLADSTKPSLVSPKPGVTKSSLIRPLYGDLPLMGVSFLQCDSYYSHDSSERRICAKAYVKFTEMVSG